MRRVFQHDEAEQVAAQLVSTLDQVPTSLAARNMAQLELMDQVVARCDCDRVDAMVAVSTAYRHKFPH